MTNKPCYFASSNSMFGFKSYFDSIYSPNKLKRIYIIKGGPGTGKSSTIKKVGEEFENSCKCEYFLCSSDTASLDGIIINDSIAVIDGTAPHATEAKYPGAVEMIIDNGQSLNASIQKRRKEIIELNSKKSNCYKNAYTYLKAVGEIKTQYIDILTEHTDIPKLDAAISRYFKQNFKPIGNYSSKIRLVQGITPNGIFNSGGFESLAKNKVIIINGKGYEEIIYKRFLEKAKEYGTETCISFDPLIPYSPNSLLMKDYSTCIVNYNTSEHGEINYDDYKVFNCERFLSKAFNSEYRGKLKFVSKCTQALTNEAIRNFSDAALIHKQLEGIYLEHTDFDIVNENINALKKDIKAFI